MGKEWKRSASSCSAKCKSESKSAWPSGCGFSGSAFRRSRPFYSFLLLCYVCQSHFAEVLRRNPSLTGTTWHHTNQIRPKQTYITRKIWQTTIEIANIGNLSCDCRLRCHLCPSLLHLQVKNGEEHSRASQEACSIRLWWWQETLRIQNS